MPFQGNSVHSGESPTPDTTSACPGPETDVVFVVGNSRSGTTMMARILENQGSVFFLREFHFFEELWTPRDRNRVLTREEAEKLVDRFFVLQYDGYLARNRHGRHADESRRFVDEHLAGNTTAHEAFHAFIKAFARRHGRRIPCDQTPRNVFYLSEILEFFSGARIINMVRDPRDILYSQKYKWNRRYLGGRSHTPLKESLRSWINYHPITMAKLWNAAVAAALKVRGDHRVLTVHYEALVQQQEETVRKICGFIGIPYDRTMLDIRQEGSSDRHDSKDERGILAENIQKWRKGGLNGTEIYLCQKISGATMENEGYEAVEVRPAIPLLVYYLLTFPAKLALALLCNLGRMKSIAETMKRRIS